MQRDGLALAVVVRREDQVVGRLHGRTSAPGRGARSPRAPCSPARSRARGRRRAWTWAGRGCARRRHGRCSHRRGTSRSSSPWRAIRRRRGFRAYRGSIPLLGEAEGWVERCLRAGTVPPERLRAVPCPGPPRMARLGLRGRERTNPPRVFPVASGATARLEPSPHRRSPPCSPSCTDTVTNWIVAVRLPGGLRPDAPGIGVRPDPVARSRCCSAGRSASAGFAGRARAQLNLCGRDGCRGHRGQPGGVLARLRRRSRGRAARCSTASAGTS